LETPPESISAVAALPGERQTSDFHCVTGWSVDKVHWEGIRAQTLIDLVRPAANARYVTFVSTEEPYVDQLTLAQFMTPDVIERLLLGTVLVDLPGKELIERVAIEICAGQQVCSRRARFRIDLCIEL